MQSPETPTTPEQPTSAPDLDPQAPAPAPEGYDAELLAILDGSGYEAPLVPYGRDALDDLMVGELAIASRKLGADVVACVQGDVDGKRWDALPLVCWLWARRANPKADVTPFRELSGGQVWALLGVGGEDPDAGDDEGEGVDENPTGEPPRS